MAIEERLFKALREEIKSKSTIFFLELEQTSGIKASSWKHVYYGHQRATSEMIEFTCRFIPSYAFWIATGATPDETMEHLSPTEEFRKEDALEEIVCKEPVDWTNAEVEIVARSLFGGQNINPALFRLMSDGMNARESKKLLNLKGLVLSNILKKEPELWSTSEINYLLFKRYFDPKDESSYEDFVKANLSPNDDLNLDLLARQEEKIAFVVEGAAFMND
jgi:hypothetical protein